MQTPPRSSGEFFDHDGLNQRDVFQHGMLFKQIGRDGAATCLVLFTHESPDIVADLHTTGLERLTHGIGLHVIVTVVGQCLENLTLHVLAGMIGKGLHGIERDCLGAGSGPDVGMDEAIAQTPFDGGNCRSEGLGDAVWRLSVDFHHAREGLKLVDGVHRGLRDVFCERQRCGHVAVVGDQAAFDLGFVGETLGGLVRNEFDQGGAAATTSQHAELAIDLLHQQRLDNAQNADAGFEMRDRVGFIFFR